MGRISKFQPNYDDLKQLRLVDLKRMDLLVGWTTSTINFMYNKKVEAIIQITIRLGFYGISHTTGYAELVYCINGESINYKVDMVQVSSNLGKRGGIWYFVCPTTQRRCRILYLSGKYFLSHYTLESTMYESQTYSKTYRSVVTIYGPAYKLDEACEALYKPYAKSHYRGRPTPKARKVLKWEALAKKVS